MGNDYDWKKIIKMVAVIGALCLFVGIATRLMHKSQTSLSDYAKKNPDVALAVSEKTQDDEGDDAGEDDANVQDTADKTDKTDKDTAGNTDKSDKTGNDGKSDKNDKTDKNDKSDKDDKSDKNDVNKLSEEEKEIYDNFFYTEETSGYKFHIMYYNSKHEKSTAEVISEVADPDETLTLFYDLYKAEHEFKNITEIQDFADRFKAEPEDDDTDIKNNTDEHNQD